MSVEIRPARDGDAPHVAALVADLGYDPEGSAGRLASVIRKDDAAVLVAEEGDRVIGWVHVHDAVRIQVEPFAFIAGLVVSADRRGAGVGERLLRAAEAWAADRGHRAIRIRSNAIRERAHGFYLARGYVVEKTSKAFHRPI